MAKSRGQDFEDEFRASIPEGVFVKKLHTPTPPPAQIEAVVAHLRRTRAPEWMVGAVSRSSHTPRQGFDMIVAPAVSSLSGQRFDEYIRRRHAEGEEAKAPGFRVPWHPGATLAEWILDLMREAWQHALLLFGALFRDASGAPFLLHARPVLLFCLELKSTTGKSFAFSRLKDHQEAALHKEALAGRIAGVVIEFAEILAPAPEKALFEDAIGDVLFIPAQSYLSYKRDADRVSLPYDIAERIGMRIEIDADRGRSRRYYKVGEFLKAFGADIPEPEKREAGRARGTLPAIGGVA